MYKYFLYFSLLFLGLSLSAQDGVRTHDRSLPCVEKNFNVLVHLSVDSTTRQPYLSQIDVDRIMADVTEYFEPICMSYSSCEINIIENYTFHDIVDSLRIVELEILYSKPHRLNVFILGSIPKAYCGLSTFHGIKAVDGGNIFLASESCPSGVSQQLAHHLGHFFGLSDTYHGSTYEIVDDPNCATVADSICDTPTDPFGLYLDSLQTVSYDVNPELANMSSFVRNCEFVFEGLDPNGQYYQPQVGNIMSAYHCKCGFTNQQLQRMARNYGKSNVKPY